MKYKYKEAMTVAEEIVGWLEGYCERIQIAGSLRRKKAEVGDIEILCIPKTGYARFKKDWTDEDFLAMALKHWIENKKKLNYRLNKKGSRVYGRQNKLLVHCASGIPVDIFSTTEENWATALVVRTGPKESNIRICMEAKKHGLKFNAYGSGFTRTEGQRYVKGSKIICYSEKNVFEVVGLPYLLPEKR